MGTLMYQQMCDLTLKMSSGLISKTFSICFETLSGSAPFRSICQEYRVPCEIQIYPKQLQFTVKSVPIIITMIIKSNIQCNIQGKPFQLYDCYQYEHWVLSDLCREKFAFWVPCFEDLKYKMKQSKGSHVKTFLTFH